MLKLNGRFIRDSTIINKLLTHHTSRHQRSEQVVVSLLHGEIASSLDDRLLGSVVWWIAADCLEFEDVHDSSKSPHNLHNLLDIDWRRRPTDDAAVKPIHCWIHSVSACFRWSEQERGFFSTVLLLRRLGDPMKICRTLDQLTIADFERNCIQMFAFVAQSKLERVMTPWRHPKAQDERLKIPSNWWILS